MYESHSSDDLTPPFLSESSFQELCAIFQEDSDSSYGPLRRTARIDELLGRLSLKRYVYKVADILDLSLDLNDSLGDSDSVTPSDSVSQDEALNQFSVVASNDVTDLNSHSFIGSGMSIHSTSSLQRTQTLDRRPFAPANIGGPAILNHLESMRESMIELERERTDTIARNANMAQYLKFRRQAWTEVDNMLRAKYEDQARIADQAAAILQFAHNLTPEHISQLQGVITRATEVVSVRERDRLVEQQFEYLVRQAEALTGRRIPSSPSSWAGAASLTSIPLTSRHPHA